jgi:hypothetical protein
MDDLTGRKIDQLWMSIKRKYVTFPERQDRSSWPVQLERLEAGSLAHVVDDQQESFRAQPLVDHGKAAIRRCRCSVEAVAIAHARRLLRAIRRERPTAANPVDELITAPTERADVSCIGKESHEASQGCVESNSPMLASMSRFAESVSVRFTQPGIERARLLLAQAWKDARRQGPRSNAARKEQNLACLSAWFTVAARP